MCAGVCHCFGDFPKTEDWGTSSVQAFNRESSVFRSGLPCLGFGVLGFRCLDLRVQGLGSKV